MHLPESMHEAVTEAKEGVKKGVRSGSREIIGEVVQGLMFFFGGAAADRFFRKRGAPREANEARAKAAEKISPEHHAEVEREIQEIGAKFAGWGLADELIELMTLVRARKHFDKIGALHLIDNLLDTILAMSESNQDRLRHALSIIDNEDQRAELLIDFAKATPEQQRKILDASDIELKPEQHSGYVFRKEVRRMTGELKAGYRAQVDETKASILAKREEKDQRREAARRARRR